MENMAGLLFWENTGLDVRSEWVQRGFVSERMWKVIPCRWTEDEKVAGTLSPRSPREHGVKGSRSIRLLLLLFVLLCLLFCLFVSLFYNNSMQRWMRSTRMMITNDAGAPFWFEATWQGCRQRLLWLVVVVVMMMSWCLMSSDVIWHIRDKLWPMPKHGSIKSTYVRCMRV